MPEAQMGAYPTVTYVACRKCGQITDINVRYPLVQASALCKAKFCPLCGTPFEPDKTIVSANGSGFLLVAAALFNKESPTKEDVEIIEGVYTSWDAYEHPTFRGYLKSLIAQG